MADTYDDLAALAANVTTNGGAGFLVRTGTKWSYPGAPTQGTNIHVPMPKADDNRVQAALTDEVWVVYRVDGAGFPDMVCLASSPAAKTKGLPFQPQDIGTPRLATPA